MPEPERGSDHAARIASLRAFAASIQGGIEAGITELGTLDDPLRVHAALQLLAQHDRFQDAVDLAESYPPHCRWIDLAIYASVALSNISSAKKLLDFANESCEAGWVSDRCRIAVADAVFTEVLGDSAGTGLIATRGVSDEERALLEFVLEALDPLVAPVRMSGRVDGAVGRLAVEFATNAYGLLGQLSQIRDLLRPMIGCRPVPLLLAQLTLRKICEPPNGLPGRLRVEHPNNFIAAFLAALLDREIYGRSQESLASLMGLQQIARAHGEEAIEQLCQALFETASALDVQALEQARSVVDGLMDESNGHRLYFDAVKLLMQGSPEAALKEMNSHPRRDDAIWWQIAAKAHELLDDLDKAAECWDQACQLMPHPDMLNRFAGLSIQQHRFQDAVRALKLAVAQSPDDPRLLEQLAFTHTRLRDFSQAGELYERLSHIQPNVLRHRINLALCHVQSGDPKSALTSLDAVFDIAHPDMQLIGLRTEILKSLGRAADAFDDLQRLKDGLWHDVRFLVLYMDTAYRAGVDNAAFLAMQQLLKMQQTGQLPKPVFRAVSRDDLEAMGADRVRQRDSLFSEVVRGKLPWLVAEALLGTVADRAWYRRTRRLTYLPDDVPSRGEWTIYATNGFSVQKDSSGRSAVMRIGVPPPGEPVVADMSAILTLHRLGRLIHVGNYFGKLIVPASYGELPVRDGGRLTPLQPSREQELRNIRDLVQRRLITVVDEGEGTDDLPLVDEYRAENSAVRFAIADVADLLRVTQRLTSDELDDLAVVCHQPMRTDRELPRDARLLFAVSTLRTLARYEWFDRVLPSVNWCVARTDYEEELREFQEWEFQRSIFSAHQAMWQEINQLRANGKLEFRDSTSCRRGPADPADDNVDPPPFVDAMLLASDLGLRLMADDRFCQSLLLNQRPEKADAAFGTDRILVGLEAQGILSERDVCADLIRMMRWRYRFLIPSSRHLKSAALQSRDNLPGPELREIAAYVQESMRDPGLFSGPESADLPTPVAFKYFMAWKDVIVRFLGALWDDPAMTSAQLQAVTVWSIEGLLPAVPREMLYSPLGRRMQVSTPRSFMLAAMVRFAGVQPVTRANEALRLMAKHLGMSDDQFYEIAAEAAGWRV